MLFNPKVHSNNWFISGTAAFGILFLAVTLSGAEFSERYKKSTSLFFAFDATTGESFWGSVNTELDEWNTHFLTWSPDSSNLSQIYPSSNYVLVKKAAPAEVSMNAPIMTMHADEIQGDRRHLKMNIRSGRDASYLNVFLSNPEDLVKVQINSQEIGFEQENTLRSDWSRWRVYGCPSEGIDIILETKSIGELKLQVTDIKQDLPEIVEFGNTPKPKHLMPQQYTFSDMSVVTQTFDLNSNRKNPLSSSK